MEKIKRREINENHFEKIPSDVICFEILPFLRPKSIINVGMVNKECYEYSKNNAIWKIVLYSNFYKKNLENIKIFYHDSAKTLDYKKIYKKMIQHFNYFSDKQQRCIFKNSLDHFQKLYKYFVLEQQMDIFDILNLIKTEESTTSNYISEKVKLLLLSKKERKKNNYIFTANFNSISNKSAAPSSSFVIFHKNQNLGFENKDTDFTRLEGKFKGRKLQGLCKFTFKNGCYVKINIGEDVNQTWFDGNRALGIMFNGNSTLYNKNNEKIFNSIYKRGLLKKGEYILDESYKEKEVIMEGKELDDSINENLKILDKELENEFYKHHFKKSKFNPIKVKEDFFYLKKKIKVLLKNQSEERKNCFPIKRLSSVLNFKNNEALSYTNENNLNVFYHTILNISKYFFRKITYLISDEELSKFIEENVKGYDQVNIIQCFISSEIIRILQIFSDFYSSYNYREIFKKQFRFTYF